MAEEQRSRPTDVPCCHDSCRDRGLFRDTAADEARHQGGPPGADRRRTDSISGRADPTATGSDDREVLRCSRFADVLIWFVVRAGDLAAGLADARAQMAPAAGLWICWPKKASKVPTDITEDTIREIALPTGLPTTDFCRTKCEKPTHERRQTTLRSANRAAAPEPTKLSTFCRSPGHSVRLPVRLGGCFTPRNHRR